MSGKSKGVDTDSAQAGRGSQPAFRSWRLILVFLVIAALAATADLWSKHAVFTDLLGHPKLAEATLAETEFLDVRDFPQLPPKDSAEFTRIVLQRLHISEHVCPGLDFTISTNPGVVFGFDAIPRWVVNLATVGMMIVVVVFFLAADRRAYWLHVALALILGGAIGNLYDRLYSSVPLPGLTPITNHVRDFIDCSSIGYVYVFNIADAWLVIGVIMVGVWQIMTAKKEKKAQAEKTKKA